MVWGEGQKRDGVLQTLKTLYIYYFLLITFFFLKNNIQYFVFSKRKFVKNLPFCPFLFIYILCS